jgi:hypothetical protein
MLRQITLGLMVLVMTSFFIAKPVQAQEVKDQVISDIVTVGITAAATLTGNIPLALASGVLAKYISTYGVAGVKSLINKFKSETPQDLGEVNIYYIYLLHMKRNLYQTLVNMRTNLKGDQTMGTIEAEIRKLEDSLSGSCTVENCQITKVDETLVNFEFVNIALDAKQSFNIFNYIQTQEVMATYQYLMLMYLDIIFVEQKLIESQYNVLANQISTLTEELDKNVYSSNEEKEYVYQLGMNLVIKWQKQRDERRANLLVILKQPLMEMETENRQLEDDIQSYSDLNDQLTHMMAY